METEDLFRFPEERAREEALRKVPRAKLMQFLHDYGRETAERERLAAVCRSAVAILAVSGQVCERFLSAWRDKTDAFGRVCDPRGFYTAFCRLQQHLSDGAQRLFEATNAPQSAPNPPYLDWAVLRLSQGLLSDADVLAAAKAAEARQQQRQLDQANLAVLQEEVRRYRTQTLGTYATRALDLSDAPRRGENAQVGALLALIAELRSAIDALAARIAMLGNKEG